ncbi:MAG: bifunctional DNA-formamidopyrimidine glycosylase/DNA-(apurinic or apyrimidinic site) lyase [Proteobacteria bacterium]|nr:bifunctional DNA-formamidopyrimidine glycosylase/DNA-(apurinic or apyrimidinic site) lyase [Pseudomonadota bacterium]
MPELPEVEVLVRHLAPVLQGKTIRSVTVRKAKICRPTTERDLTDHLTGARFLGLMRRGKYLVFTLRRSAREQPFTVTGHLGMTGRMYLLPKHAPLPKHAVVVLGLGANCFVYEDPRQFGRFTLDDTAVKSLGPEPLGEAFTIAGFASELKRSTQAIKVKLLDQSLVTGVGNIYASESLFRAGVSPRKGARRLKLDEVARLHASIRDVLAEAIECGSTIPLDFAGSGKRDGLFYYGAVEGNSPFYQERLRVYDQAGKPCLKCATPIKRLVQAARSTFYCPCCQM